MNNTDTCCFCKKRPVDKNFSIPVRGFKLHSQDLGTVRVDRYNVFHIGCCPTCYRRQQKLNKFSKVFLWISVVLFVVPIIIGVALKSYSDILGIAWLLAIPAFIVSFILDKFWEYFLKYMK